MRSRSSAAVVSCSARSAACGGAGEREGPARGVRQEPAGRQPEACIPPRATGWPPLWLLGLALDSLQLCPCRSCAQERLSSSSGQPRCRLPCCWVARSPPAQPPRHTPAETPAPPPEPPAPQPPPPAAAAPPLAQPPARRSVPPAAVAPPPARPAVLPARQPTDKLRGKHVWETEEEGRAQPGCLAG